jgi:hypothetical protein
MALQGACGIFFSADIVIPRRWSSRAVRSFTMAELEARKMRYPTTGTEGLLMGILVEGEANVLRFCYPQSAFMLSEYIYGINNICHGHGGNAFR